MTVVSALAGLIRSDDDYQRVLLCGTENQAFFYGNAARSAVKCPDLMLHVPETGSEYIQALFVCLEKPSGHGTHTIRGSQTRPDGRYLLFTVKWFDFVM